jgi:hypothetical protein
MLLADQTVVVSLAVHVPLFAVHRLQRRCSRKSVRLSITSEKDLSEAELLAETTLSKSVDALTSSKPLNGEASEDDEECMVGTMEVFDGGCLPLNLVTLPRHSHEKVNGILSQTEQLLREMHVNSTEIETASIKMAKEAGHMKEFIFANNYVDLGKIKT